MKRPIAFSFSLLVWMFGSGCGGDESSGDGGAPGSVRGCSADDASLVFGPTSLESMSGPLASMSTDGTTLFFTRNDGLYSVPLAGGVPTRTLATPSAIHVNHFVRDTDVIVYSTSLSSVPKTGGAATPLPAFTRFPRRTGSTGYVFAELVGDQLVAREETGSSSVTSTYFTHTLATGAQTTILTTPDTAGSRFVVLDGSIYVTRQSGAGGAIGEDSLVSTLLRIPVAGGSPVEVPLMPSLERHVVVLASMGDALILFARAKGAPSFDIVRVPATGGMVEVLAQTSHPNIALDQVRVARAGTSVVIQVTNQLHLIRAGASNTAIFGCGDTTARYTQHALTASGESAYLNIYDGTESKNIVVRLPFPD
jgi:hypothetical protein